MLLTLGVAAPALTSAQQARASFGLAGSVPRGELPEPLLTLRPSPELLALAVEAADVLELRTGQHVEIGEPPPPGLMEAVPAGHVALALDEHGTIVIVLGAAGGLSHDTVVRLGGQSGEHVDARAVALAVETLRDLAMESSETRHGVAIERTRGTPQQAQQAPAPGDRPRAAHADRAHTDRASLGGATETNAAPPDQRPTVRDPQAGTELRDGGGSARVDAGFLGEVEPLAYVRAYSGASLASPGPRMGLGTGLGLCVERHCLVVFGEVPMNFGATDPIDTRYQYTTFGSGFYTRPFQWGSFTPGASVGFVTRLGYFEQDMGLPSDDLQTDLGARATLEMGYELLNGLDLVAEGGADLILDRLRVQNGDTAVDRGERLSPWLQASVRYRL
jgi:hypothetical protein